MLGIVKTSSQNLKSIINCLDFLNIKSNIIDDIDQINDYEKIILPGVGAFDPVVKSIKKIGINSDIIKNILINNSHSNNTLTSCNNILAIKVYFPNIWSASPSYYHWSLISLYLKNGMQNFYLFNYLNRQEIAAKEKAIPLTPKCNKVSKE